jgi:phage/conjugal plasmid C-4 type zinc finger TraR family protein
METRLQRIQQIAHAVSAVVCVDCGFPIPQPRSEAVRGCTRCVDCQEVAEVRKCA